LDQPLPFDVTLRPTDPAGALTQTVLVFDRFDTYTVGSSVGEDAYTGIKLLPKTPKELEISLVKANPGLIRVRATIPDWDQRCPVLDQTVDTGFATLVRIVADNKNFLTKDEASASKTDSPSAFPAGKPQDFVIEFLDQEGHTFDVRAPVTLLLTVFDGAQLSEDDASWVNKLPMTIAKGHQSDRIFLRTRSWAHGRGTVDIAAKKDSGEASIAQYSLIYTVDYAWWVYLLATLAGAIGYTSIETLVASNRDFAKFWDNLAENYGSKLWIALITGGVAYLLRGANILGALHFDSATVQGHVALGFLFCIVGLEAIFKKVVKLVSRN
jgi:hypothetical protein